MFHFKGFNKPDKIEFARMKRDISSWSKISDLIYNTNDPLDVYRILYVEFNSRDRDYNITRLYQRFNRLRCNQELKQIEELLVEVPINEKLRPNLANQTRLNIFLGIVEPSKATYLKLLKLEYLGLNRAYMVRLLHGRFQKLRREEEVQTL